MRKVLDLPGGWELQADGRRPFLEHRDGRRLEPKEAALEADAQSLYRALKLEEDRLGRVHAGAEHREDWLTIWSARVVIGDYFNRKVNPDGADELLHSETEQLAKKEQLERARLWTPRGLGGI
jgi:hypothetical protein